MLMPPFASLAFKSWVLCVLPFSFAQAQILTAASLASKVDSHYNHLHSLQARYTERYRGLGMDRSETGTLLLAKPGRMRWNYDSPAGKVFLLDGKYAISYTPGSAQADRMPAKQLDDLRSPLRFLLGHAELAKELDHLSLTPLASGYTLSGTPRGAVGNVRTLSLTVSAQGVIEGMRIEETDGANTDFTFTDMREDVPVPADAFRFTPPAGVTIVDGAKPI